MASLTKRSSSAPFEGLDLTEDEQAAQPSEVSNANNKSRTKKHVRWNLSEADTAVSQEHATPCYSTVQVMSKVRRGK